MKADGLEIFQDALRRWLYPSTRSVASMVRGLNLTAAHDLLVYKLWMERVISDVFQKFEFLLSVQPVAAKITLMTVFTDQMNELNYSFFDGNVWIQIREC